MPIIGVSLKMYFDAARARAWFSRIAEICRSTPEVTSGQIEVFIAPSFISLQAARDAFAGTGVKVAAQNSHWEDSGAFTGEVSPVELADVGVEIVEVGHAERRRLFGESNEIVAAKTAAVLRNGMTPLICVGEGHPGSDSAAVARGIEQLRGALDAAPPGRVIVAYEPVWAIGASEPAPLGQVSFVCSALKAQLMQWEGRSGSSVIYGGSAGPGIISQLAETIDGVFLGRFAHSPETFERVLHEARLLAE